MFSLTKGPLILETFFFGGGFSSKSKWGLWTMSYSMGNRSGWRFCLAILLNQSLMTSYRHMSFSCFKAPLFLPGDDTDQQIKARVLKKLGCGLAFWLGGTSQTTAGNNARPQPNLFQDF